MASATAPDPTQKESSLRRVVTASMAGTVVEWYEFFLYATAATLVFNIIMFPPSDDPYTPIIQAFLTYAVGFIARPLGGVILAGTAGAMAGNIFWFWLAWVLGLVVAGGLYYALSSKVRRAAIA